MGFHGDSLGWISSCAYDGALFAARLNRLYSTIPSKTLAQPSAKTLEAWRAFIGHPAPTTFYFGFTEVYEEDVDTRGEHDNSDHTRLGGER